MKLAFRAFYAKSQYISYILLILALNINIANPNFAMDRAMPKCLHGKFQKVTRRKELQVMIYRFVNMYFNIWEYVLLYCRYCMRLMLTKH